MPPRIGVANMLTSDPTAPRDHAYQAIYDFTEP